jgi:integrase
MSEDTCYAMLDAYMLEHAKVKLVAHKRQQYAVNNLEPHFGHLLASEITPLEINDYCAKRAVSPSTQRRELAVLSAALRHAVKMRRLAPADVPDIELPEQAPPKGRWLDRDELKMLFEAAERLGPSWRQSRLYLFVALAYYTGSRRGAIEALPWSRVDFERSRITLQEPGTRQTSKRRPVVPISPLLLPVLQAAYEERINEWVLDSAAPIYCTFMLAVRKLGWDDVTPHTLRHSRAVHLAQDGVSLYQIAGLLGDTVATVERNYLHHCPDHLRGVMDADRNGLTTSSRRRPENPSQ